MLQSFKSIAIEFRIPLKEKLKSLFCQDNKFGHVVSDCCKRKCSETHCSKASFFLFGFYTGLSKSALKLFLQDADVFSRVYVLLCVLISL